MRPLAFAIAVPLLATATWAQTPQMSTPSEPSGKTTQSPDEQTAQQPNQQPNQQAQQRVRQQVRANLERSGFTDIQVMPSSFLVRAKDRQGNPVVMFITPRSVTALTRVPGRNETTGQGGSSNQGNPAYQGNQMNQGNTEIPGSQSTSPQQ